MLIFKAITEESCFKYHEFYREVRHLLECLQANTLIYIDSEEQLLSKLTHYVDSIENGNWKKNTQEILIQLKKNKRFIVNKKLDQLTFSNINKILKKFNKEELDAILTDQKNIISNQVNNIELINFVDFDISRLSNKIKNNAGFTSILNPIDKIEFKESVLKPIMKNSGNYFEIFDFHIGRALYGDGNCYGKNNEQKNIEFSKNYKRTIKFLIDAFIEFSDQSMPRNFQITTGTGLKPFFGDYEVERVILESYSKYSEKTKFNFQMNIRKERRWGPNISHPRFLFTNSFYYSFDKGFGFLDNEDKVSEWIKNLDMHEKDKVEKIRDEARKLDKFIIQIKWREKTPSWQ